MPVGIKVTGARVLIEEIPPENLSMAGIVIPDTSKTPTLKGVVIDVGPGIYTEHGQLIPTCVEPEDLVLLQPLSGSRIAVNGKEYIIINDRDILAIISKNVRVENNARFIG